MEKICRRASSAGGRAEAGLRAGARLMLFVDDCRDNTDWPMFALSNGTTYPKLRQARADFKASDTSTGISPGNPTSNLAPWLPIVEHRTGVSILSSTVS